MTGMFRRKPHLVAVRQWDGTPNGAADILKWVVESTKKDHNFGIAKGTFELGGWDRGDGLELDALTLKVWDKSFLLYGTEYLVIHPDGTLEVVPPHEFNVLYEENPSVEPLKLAVGDVVWNEDGLSTVKAVENTGVMVEPITDIDTFVEQIYEAFVDTPDCESVGEPLVPYTPLENKIAEAFEPKNPISQELIDNSSFAWMELCSGRDDCKCSECTCKVCK